MDFRLAQFRFASIGGNKDLVQSLLENLQKDDKFVKIEDFLEKDSPLVLAVLAGHVGVAQLILSKARSLNLEASTVFNYKIPAHNKTCLEWASHSGNLEMTRLFVEDCAQLDKNKNDATNAFIFAFESHHLEVCEMLLDKYNARLVKISLPATFLHKACKVGKLASITFLIETGIVENEKIQRREVLEGEGNNVVVSPMDVAIQYNHLDVLNYLLLSVSKTNYYNTQQIIQFLVLACRHKCLSAIDELLPRIGDASLLSKSPQHALNSTSPLNAACIVDNIELVKRLLSRGAPVDYNNLSAAVESGNITLLELLLQSGGKKELDKLPPIVKHCRGDNPMKAVAINGRVDMANMLIQWGGNKLSFAPSGSEVNSRTPLSYACAHGHYAVAKLLLDTKSDIQFMPFFVDQLLTSSSVKIYLTVIAETGMTMNLHALNRYVEYQQVDELDAWLDEKDALPTIANTIMSLYNDQATEKRMENLRSYLQQGLSYDCLLKAYNSNQQFLTGNELFGIKNVDIIRTLLEIGLLPDAEVNRLLLSACTLRKFELAACLINDYGARFTMCPELNVAIQDGGDAVIDLLIDSGFDVNSIDSINPFPVGGNSLLKWVCLARLIPSTKRLLTAGVNVNYQDALGRTALHWLATSAHLVGDEEDLRKMDLVTLLLESGADREICDNPGFSAKVLLQKHGCRLAIESSTESSSGDVVTGLQGLSVNEAEEVVPRRKVKRRSTTDIDK